MNKKENKGGFLSNEQLEQDQRVHGNGSTDTHPYHGSQDTGDRSLRDRGTEVQQRDGYTPEDEQDTGRA
ncbi:hypothetical protein [Flaviaesturariibacter amylovorans]